MTHEFNYSSVIIAPRPGDTPLQKQRVCPSENPKTTLGGTKNWINLGFWETDNLPLPYANILP